MNVCRVSIPTNIKPVLGECLVFASTNCIHTPGTADIISTNDQVEPYTSITVLRQVELIPLIITEISIYSTRNKYVDVEITRM